MSARFYVPTKGVQSWQELLAEPQKHWKPEYSAYELATAWEHAQGFPQKVYEVLKASFVDLQYLLGVPEHQVPLKGGARPSQTDLWVIAKSGDALLSIAVEGKVHETFGDSVGKWNTGGDGKTTRLAYLCNVLGLCDEPFDELRYQLFHRTASAVIEADRFNARHAILLVHTFFTDPSRDSFSDYCNFLKLFGVDGIRNGLVTAEGRVGEKKDVTLHFGWVEGK